MMLDGQVTIKTACFQTGIYSMFANNMTCMSSLILKNDVTDIITSAVLQIKIHDSESRGQEEAAVCDE